MFMKEKHMSFSSLYILGTFVTVLYKPSFDKISL